jgi:2-keto-3-deoxy-L-rhamnonate aldolase RhmA
MGSIVAGRSVDGQWVGGDDRAMTTSDPSASRYLVNDRSSRVRPGLRQPGAPTIGTWVKLPTLETLELLAHAGFEFVVVDMEHSPLGLESVYRLVFGAQALGMAALVRVADRSGNLYQRVLDAGVDGILVPQVTSADEARAAIAGMTFAPDGRRGMGLTARAGRWGLAGMDSYLATGEDIVRCVQIEDLHALRHADRILDVDGLDAVFVGMGDLTMSSRLPADHPEIRGATDRLLELARERGVPCGAAVGDAAGAAVAAERGFSFIMVSNDASMFARAAFELGAAVRVALG